MQFSEFNLDPRLLQAVSQLGFELPTPIQVAAVPPALSGRDIWGSAETGTGKTAAFLLPILQRFINAAASSKREPRTMGRRVRALIVVPTRELALQVADHAEKLSRYVSVRSTAIYGGVGLENQAHILRRGVDIVIATPGRLLDHVERKNIDLQHVEVLVLDEADRMLDVGFLPDLRRIVRVLPRERQTMLFSATLAPEIYALASEVTRDAVRIEVAKAAAPVAIHQALFPVPENAKLQVLTNLLRQEEMQSVLVFARTKHRADRLADQLQRANINAGVIHGNRSQGQRVAALEAFRRGRSRVLVATDIAARGIDVVGVTHVINYDLPMQPEDYIHRIGRTGRADAAGTAYTLSTPTDEDMVRRIQAMIKHPIQRRRAEGMPESALVTPPPPPVGRRSFGSRRPGFRPSARRSFAR